jgi:hypothetical protein
MSITLVLSETSQSPQSPASSSSRRSITKRALENVSRADAEQPSSVAILTREDPFSFRKGYINEEELDGLKKDGRNKLMKYQEAQNEVRLAFGPLFFSCLSARLALFFIVPNPPFSFYLWFPDYRIRVLITRGPLVGDDDV